MANQSKLFYDFKNTDSFLTFVTFTDAIHNFKTTAVKSSLTSYELNCLGFRETHIVKIDVRESNGLQFEDRLPESLVEHFWTVLGQSAANIQRFRTARIPKRGFRITYKLENPIYLPHLSQDPLFDLYEVPPTDHDNDLKLTVYQCVLVGSLEE